MQCKELALHVRTMLVQNLLTHYLEKLTAYQHQVIKLCQKKKNEYLLG